jgi:protein-L-isoaspartate(D-aspartate) O-methyltransferase
MKRLMLALLVGLGISLPACASTPVDVSPTPAQRQVPSSSPQPISPPPLASPTSDPYREARQHMVRTQMRTRDIQDERVLAVMEKVPRQEFVPHEVKDQAFEDHPLPIGFGQTISQPYIVALMTQMLDLQPDDKVLEIGTGSGYQAAVLAELTPHVYTIEIIPELAQRARSTLDRLGYDYVASQQADGYWGWEEHAPFDAIIVTAAPDHIPQPLLQQLADGGRMVIPVGPPGGYQSLWLITREGDEFHNFNWGGVSFVPFTREQK